MADDEVAVTPSLLRAANCWSFSDRVTGDEAATEFRRRARFHQSQWREKRNHEIGHHPYEGGNDAALIGSRLALNYARETGANFLSPSALSAVRHRLSYREQHQMLDEERLWADLLSSMPLCFNLFGPLSDDKAEAVRLTRHWFLGVPGEFVEVKFEWSPGRADPLYLGNRSAFDAALLLGRERIVQGVIGIETKYHEALEKARPPKAETASRYREVADRSGIFAPAAADILIECDLQQIWQDHLLLLSMLQHPSRQWQWGCFVLVYPAKNVAYASAVARYREFLLDDTSFFAVTLEKLLEVGGLSEIIAAPLRERYLW